MGLQVIRPIRGGLAPHQLECGLPFGCESAAHAARFYLHNMPSNCLMLRLDFRNAFNTLRRDKMLSAVLEVALNLFSFIHSAYSEPSFLFCGENVLSSVEGVQQGDLLSPLLFCLTIQPIVEK